MFSITNSEEDDSDDIVYNTDNKKVIKIDANADGTCFLHSVLKCAYPEYQEVSSVNGRQEIAYKFRSELKGLLREPNPKYSTLSDVVQFVKESLLGKLKGSPKHTKGKKFKYFLKLAYGYEFADYPVEIKPYNVHFFDSKEKYLLYIVSYREYLMKYDGYLSGIEKDLPKPPILSRVPNSREITLIGLDIKVIEFAKGLEKAQENISKKVDDINYMLKKKLQNELKEQLYNPQNFGCSYIQAHLKGEELPEGMYSELPYNCYFFTANSGVLSRFEYYPERLIPRLEDIEHILSNTRAFLGDADIIPFVPAMYGINILTIDFRNNILINEYTLEYENDRPWIVIANNNNTHFDACGMYNEDGRIETIFRKMDPFIQMILDSKKYQGKIFWENLDKKPEPIILKTVTPLLIRTVETVAETPKIPLKNMTIVELKKFATDRSIKIPSGLKKSEMIEYIENKM
jgi:hypothetical protein